MDGRRRSLAPRLQGTRIFALSDQWRWKQGDPGSAKRVHQAFDYAPGKAAQVEADRAPGAERFRQPARTEPRP